MDRATGWARTGVAAMAAAWGSLSQEIQAWIRNGDNTLFVVIGVLGVLLLVTIVVPARRRY